jgi:ParB/RepB/Spo0J family partition protein
LIEELPVELIDENPFNSRRFYNESDIRKLSRSLAEHGLLEPVRARRFENRYQLVYGHTRLRAAKLLKWKTITTHVNPCPDGKMLELSYVENDSRHALSDYEKGLAFSRMNREFKRTFEDIGNSVGYSRSHVCNLVHMTELFDEVTLANKEVTSALHHISEHHARILAQIQDDKSRLEALQIAVSHDLTVRDLQRIVQRFRSWFGNSSQTRESDRVEDYREDQFTRTYNSSDQRAIEELIENEVVLPVKGDFNSFVNMHAYGIGYCSFNDVPPLQRLEGREALRNDKEWFYSMAPRYSAEIFDLRIQVVGLMALATFYISYINRGDGQDTIITRATVVCIKNSGNWKILHEHGSRLEGDTLLRLVHKNQKRSR